MTQQTKNNEKISLSLSVKGVNLLVQHKSLAVVGGGDSSWDG